MRLYHPGGPFPIYEQCNSSSNRQQAGSLANYAGHLFPEFRSYPQRRPLWDFRVRQQDADFPCICYNDELMRRISSEPKSKPISKKRCKNATKKCCTMKHNRQFGETLGGTIQPELVTPPPKPLPEKIHATPHFFIPPITHKLPPKHSKRKLCEVNSEESFVSCSCEEENNNQGNAQQSCYQNLGKAFPSRNGPSPEQRNRHFALVQITYDQYVPLPSKINLDTTTQTNYKPFDEETDPFDKRNLKSTNSDPSLSKTENEANANVLSSNSVQEYKSLALMPRDAKQDKKENGFKTNIQSSSSMSRLHSNSRQIISSPRKALEHQIDKPVSETPKIVAVDAILNVYNTCAFSKGGSLMVLKTPVKPTSTTNETPQGLTSEVTELFSRNQSKAEQNKIDIAKIQAAAIEQEIYQQDFKKFKLRTSADINPSHAAKRKKNWVSCSNWKHRKGPFLNRVIACICGNNNNVEYRKPGWTPEKTEDDEILMDD